MPRLSLDTNVPASKVPDDFLSTCTDILSKTLGKKMVVSIFTYILCDYSVFKFEKTHTYYNYYNDDFTIVIIVFGFYSISLKIINILLKV